MAEPDLRDEPAVAARSVPSTDEVVKIPSGLHREPSQQDLEIARQLQNFHQGLPPHAQERDVDAASHTSRAATDLNHESEHAESVDSHSQAASDVPLPSELHPQRMPSQEPPVSGQICTNCGTTKTPLWRRSPAGAVICNACGLYYKARNQMRPVGLKRTTGPAAIPQRTQTEHDVRGTSPTSLQGGATYVSADQSTNGTCPGGGRCNGTGGHDGCNGCPAYNNRISKTAQVALRQSSDAAESSGVTEQPNSNQAAAQTVVVACQNCGTTITPLWRRDEAGNAICNACGLYFKLHGQHRPVQMKKAEIKRRKRVVPATLQSEQYIAPYSNSQSQLGTPEIRPSLLPTHPASVMEPRTAPGPIPVDFTDAFRSRLPASDSHSYHVPSKRAFSATGADTEHYPHAQNMGFAAINAIDPALPTREPPISKEARMMELQREADRMRQMLQEKERELAALVDER